MTEKEARGLKKKAPKRGRVFFPTTLPLLLWLGFPWLHVTLRNQHIDLHFWSSTKVPGGELYVDSRALIQEVMQGRSWMYMVELSAAALRASNYLLVNVWGERKAAYVLSFQHIEHLHAWSKSQKVSQCDISGWLCLLSEVCRPYVPSWAVVCILEAVCCLSHPVAACVRISVSCFVRKCVLTSFSFWTHCICSSLISLLWFW